MSIDEDLAAKARARNMRCMVDSEIDAPPKGRCVFNEKPVHVMYDESRPAFRAAVTQALCEIERDPKAILSRTDPSMIVGFCGIYVIRGGEFLSLHIQSILPVVGV